MVHTWLTLTYDAFGTTAYIRVKAGTKIPRVSQSMRQASFYSKDNATSHCALEFLKEKYGTAETSEIAE